MNKRVTVLIAAYQADEDFVQSKISSLLDQTWLWKANIVILNCEDLCGESRNFRGFCDGQARRWRKPGMESANVTEVLYNDYVRLYKTWNDGIKITQSDYIVNYNMDDQWHPEYLEKCINFLDCHQEYAVVSSRVLITDKPHQVWHRAPWESTGQFPFAAYPRSSAGPCPMWRRSLHDKYGYFTDHYVIGDAIMWEKWLAGGEKFGLIDEQLVLYYRNPVSLERRHQDGIRLIDIDLNNRAGHG